MADADLTQDEADKLMAMESDSDSQWFEFCAYIVGAHAWREGLGGRRMERFGGKMNLSSGSSLHPDLSCYNRMIQSASTSHMPLKPIAANPGSEKKVYLLKPRGFCAGVVRAIDVVKIALDLYGPPVYVRREIVHNKHVVDELREAGAIFVEEISEVPVGARAIFSAHGVAPEVRREAAARRLEIIDATCPLVTKVHLEAVRFARDGYSIVLIGHSHHDEVIGTLGEAPDFSYLVETVEDVDRLELPNPTRVRYLTQTTLSLDETRDIIIRLKQRFPLIEGPPAQDICYATENRQMAVKGVAEYCDLLLVVGSQNSSNSKRLVEVSANAGVRAYLVNDYGEVDIAWLNGVRNVAVTAGASAPENLVADLVGFLRDQGFHRLEEVELIDEDVRFSLPPELTRAAPALTLL